MRRSNLPTTRRVFTSVRHSYSTLLGHRANRSYPGRSVQMRRPHSAIPARQAASEMSQPSLAQTLRRQAELEQELQLARDIQQGLLLAAVPHLPRWEISAVSLPAHDLGGDLYDFLRLQHDTQGIMIGDVAGKGLPAALQMAVTRTVFRHEARTGVFPSQTLMGVNQSILVEIPKGTITMLYALLDPDRGTLRIANAGHPFPLIINNTVEEIEVSGLPLGIDKDSDYDEATVMIEPGNSVVFYSDGVTEALNEADEMFGFERLHLLLRTHRTLKPRALMTKLLHELRTWGTPQSDDLTIVVLRRRLTDLNDELHTIMCDVLGAERAALLWKDVPLHLHQPALHDTPCDAWSKLVPTITHLVQMRFGRGLARELHQQLRLVIEEYRS